MKNTKIRTLKNLGVLLIAVAVFIVAGNFLKTASLYTLHSVSVIVAENQGETPTNTASGPQTWLPEQVKTYKLAFEAKEEFAKSCDFAKFLYDCGGSITGKIVRVVVCFVIIAISVISFWLSYTSSKAIFKATRRILKAKYREIK